MKATTEHAQGWVAASLVGVAEARVSEPARTDKHDFDEACLKRIEADLRVKGMLVEALENATLLCNCGHPDRCETDGRRPCSYVAVASALREAKKP